MDLNSGAESGWDFTSRWYLENRTLAHTRTSRIIPTDLNALLCLNEITLASFHRILGESPLTRFCTVAAVTQRPRVRL